MFPTKISTKLTSWQPVTLEEFQVWVYYPLAATINQAIFSNIMQSKYNKEKSLLQERPVLKNLIEEGFIQESDMLFQAVFERSKGWLLSLIRLLLLFLFYD